MLVAYIPISKWEVTLASTEFRSKQHRVALPGILNRRLFHYCMAILCEPLRKPKVHEVVDPEGNIRLIIYVLIAYLADLEEQYKIAPLDKSNCIHCKATTMNFGSPNKHEPRTSQSILESIKQVQAERGTNADVYEFALGCDKHRLGDVEFPFWESLPFMDICNVLSVHLLHGFHMFFLDHPFKWNINSLGEDKINAQKKSQVALVGGRVFPKGVTHISQMSGKEHRALETVHLGVVANAPIQYSREITLATRSLLDFVYLGKLPSHTDTTLAAFEDTYNCFHQHKGVWLKNGARQGEKGNLIPHFNIPKLHTAGHLAEQVRAKGTADNYSMEVIEHLHIDLLKEPYKATNRKEWKRQTIQYLVRHQKLVDFSLWLGWNLNRGNVGDGGSDATNAECLGEAHDAAGKSPNSEARSMSDVVKPAARRSAPSDPHNARTSDNISQHNHQYTLDNIPVPHPVHLVLNHLLTVFSNLQALLTGSATQPTKKHKRKPADEKEERSSKRIALSQQTYGLMEYQDLSLRPISRMSVSNLQELYQLPGFLTDYQGSTHQAANPIDENMVVETWQSIRLIEGQRRFHAKPEWRRVQAAPPTDTEVAVADPVLYTKESFSGNKGSSTIGLDGELSPKQVHARKP